VIAFLTAVFGKRGNENDKKRMRFARDRDLPYPRVLIISPGSVMSNWERELSTVTPPNNHTPNPDIGEADPAASGDGGTQPFTTARINPPI